MYVAQLCFKKFEQELIFLKLYQVNKIHKHALFSPSYKVQQTFKFTLWQLICNHIWYVFAAIN